MRASRIGAVIASLGLLWPAVAALAQDMWVTTPDGTLSIPLYRQPGGGLAMHPPPPPAPTPDFGPNIAAACSEIVLDSNDPARLARLKVQWKIPLELDMQDIRRGCNARGFLDWRITDECAHLLASAQDRSLDSAIDRGDIDPGTAIAALSECRWLMTGSGPDPYADLRPSAR